MIVLISDFGSQDHFVGQIKGVILSLKADARIVDLCHGIPSYFIPAASFVLETSVRHFPNGTIFLVVVDPGVGTERRILMAFSQKCFFIAPDNGVLTPILAGKREVEVRFLDAEHIYLQKEHSTFEARDRMAPAAAHISHGMNWEFLGEKTETFVVNEDYFPKKTSDRQIAGMVVHIDKFGNIVSNIPAGWIAEAMEKKHGSSFMATVGGKEIRDRRDAYAGPSGRPFMLYGSHGNLEIAFTQESAASQLKVSLGDPITLQIHG